MLSAPGRLWESWEQSGTYKNNRILATQAFGSMQESYQRLADASQASWQPPKASWRPPGSHWEASWRPHKPPRSLQELTRKLPRDLLNLQEASRRPPGSFPETSSRHPGTPDCFHQPPESSSKPRSLEIPKLAKTVGKAFIQEGAGGSGLAQKSSKITRFA